MVDTYSLQEVIAKQEQETSSCSTGSTSCIGCDKVKLPNNTVTGMMVWPMELMKNGTLKKLQLVTNISYTFKIDT